MKLYISTFGEFDIKSNGDSLLKDLGRTYKLYKLFQFFLTFRNKKLLPETIIDSLWSDSESSDPKNMIRTQIFRLRGFIKSLIPEGANEWDYISIDFMNGSYYLKIGKNVILDVDQFESFINEGDLIKDDSYEEAISIYYEAIGLYRGIYLAENSYEVWLVPTRNYYNRLFLKTLYKLIDLLKYKEEYEKIIALCENALLLEPYEEGIHIQMLDALMAMGYQKEALNHYENTEALLEKEMGTKPSKEFTSYLKKICDGSYQSSMINIEIINDEISNVDVQGALLCSKEDFRFLVNVQKRKTLRENELDYIGLLTINEDFYSDNIEDYSKNLTELLKKTLRKGDVFTFWNNSQVLLLLHNVRDDGILKIKNRIKKNINQNNFRALNLNSLIFQPLNSEDITF